MKLELTQKLRQEQILAPQMILSMDILLLSNLQLENRIQDEFMSNPALEMVEPEGGGEAAGSEAPDGEASPPASPDPADLARQEADIFTALDSFGSLSPFAGLEPRTKRHDGDLDEKIEALSNVADRPEGLREHLTGQIHLLDVSPAMKEICENIVNNLDPRGYLLFPPEEIRGSLGEAVTDVDFGKALETVRSLDPSGVGAENLRDCLVLQLRRDSQEYSIEIEIIQKHLEDLRLNRLPKIAHDLGRTVEEIVEARDIIASLNPAPGGPFDNRPVIRVRPEVTVEKVEGKFEVKVHDESLPQLGISPACRRLLQEARGDPQVLSFVRKKIETAQWLIQAVRQRQRTVYDIAKAIVDYQTDFMENGPTRLRALKMQTIADLVGVHISTISRAIKGKYMQTPWGTFDMRFFFTGGVERSDGVLESRRNISREIGELIAGENKSRPLSDTGITRILRERGLDIARRTVTKYREQEGIPSSRLRKQY